MEIQFTKMSGTGNDFVMIDNTDALLAEAQLVDLVKRMSPRQTSVGADGVIFVQKEADGLRMRYFNADGSEAEMCGNGARCFAEFSRQLGLVGDTFEFQTLAGVIKASFTPLGVKVGLGTPSPIEHLPSVEFNGTPYDIQRINTGVPHALLFVDDIETVDVCGLGAGIR